MQIRVSNFAMAMTLAVMLMVLCCEKLFAQPLPCPPSKSSALSIRSDTSICLGACLLLKPNSISTDMKSTKTYGLSNILYKPYNYTLGTQVLTNLDDVWSDPITLPFDFCFFGKKYKQCVIGANGNISFDIGLANASEPYSVHPAPFNGPCYNNCIMGAYYDIDPSKGGEIRLATYGTIPCRTFVISWANIPLFDCSSLTGTQQIVLYESTYAIDVFVRHRPICPSWEHGNGVLGIQNEDASIAYTFAGRNGVPWEDSNAAYRFTPNAPPDLTYKWYDNSTGIALASTDTFTVCPTISTTYLLRANFSSQCDVLSASDTVKITVNSIPSVADFVYNIRYGCKQDTVSFQNQSKYSTPPLTGERFLWDFGDGSTDTSRSPKHTYKSIGDYTVTLTTKGDGVCEDKITKHLLIEHTLHAGFTVDKDSFCSSGVVAFTDTSTVTHLYTIAPTYRWIYGDSQSDTGIINPSHTFQNPGLYHVMQIVGNGIPCYDTAYKIIVVDSIPFAQFTMSDTELCVGSILTLSATYLQNGFKQLTWSFGDGTYKLGDNPTEHVYEHAGYFTVKFSAAYNVCPDTTVSQQVLVKPFPIVYLGPDTTICTGSEMFKLQDTQSHVGKNIYRQWNTGDTTIGIWVRHPGLYSLRVKMDGCTASDTINVEKGCYINIPNAFTPNGDGENDNFIPLELLSRNIVSYRLRIFSRWGQMIYDGLESDHKGWDGNFNGVPQPMGAYVYVLNVKFKNDVKEYYQGNVTLIR